MEPLSPLLIKLKERHAKYPSTDEITYFELIQMIEEVFEEEREFQEIRNQATINEMH